MQDPELRWTWSFGDNVVGADLRWRVGVQDVRANHIRARLQFVTKAADGIFRGPRNRYVR